MADTLSRASLNDSILNIEAAEIKCYVHIIASNYLISDYRLQQFQHEMKTEELQTFLAFIQNGWPKHQDQILETVHSYYTQKQELCIALELFSGITMLVPKTLWNEMRLLLHTSHLGI